MSNPIEHFVSATCTGDYCARCNEPATHKVGEEIAYDDPGLGRRHNFTNYLCCEHFGELMGPAAIKWCRGEWPGRGRVPVLPHAEMP